MSFIDRYEEQLRQASESLQVAAPKRRRRWRRPGFVIPVLVVAVAGPSAAIVRPWSPAVGRSGEVLSSRVPVAEEAKDAFAVLRRPQTARDRAAAGPLLRRIERPLDEIQVGDVRRIGPGWAVVPVQQFDAPRGSESRGGAQICVIGSGTIGCSPLGVAAANGVVVLSAGAGYTRYRGLVPEGVASVRFTSAATGRVFETKVRENFIWLTIDEVGPRSMVRPLLPDGKQMRRAVPSPPMPARGTFQWLNAEATVVGPH